MLGNDLLIYVLKKAGYLGLRYSLFVKGVIWPAAEVHHPNKAL